jgi:hypothetical protein
MSNVSNPLTHCSDCRTLLVLMLRLGSAYETLVQIWATTPDLTADKAIWQLRAKHYRLAHQEPRDDVGFLVIRKRRGGFSTTGEPLAKRVATGGGENTCSSCGREHPGPCWLGLTCDYCKRKGHPTGRCYDNPDSPNYKGSRSNTTAVFVAVDEKVPVNTWC